MLIGESKQKLLEVGERLGLRNSLDEFFIQKHHSRIQLHICCGGDLLPHLPNTLG